MGPIQPRLHRTLRSYLHFNTADDDDSYTPERRLPTPGQRGHSPQRHTAAGTAAPTATDTGNTVPQRANPTFYFRLVLETSCILIPSRTRDLYIKRAAPYVKAPSLLLSFIYTNGLCSSPKEGPGPGEPLSATSESNCRPYVSNSYSRRLRLLSVVVPFLALALCSCERFAGVGGVFSVGVSCVRVTC